MVCKCAGKTVLPDLSFHCVILVRLLALYQNYFYGLTKIIFKGRFNLLFIRWDFELFYFVLFFCFVINLWTKCT